MHCASVPRLATHTGPSGCFKGFVTEITFNFTIEFIPLEGPCRTRRAHLARRTFKESSFLRYLKLLVSQLGLPNSFALRARVGLKGIVAPDFPFNFELDGYNFLTAINMVVCFLGPYGVSKEDNFVGQLIAQFRFDIYIY